MAADEQSKSEFTSILSSIDRKFDIIHTKWTEDKFFEAKFRTQIPRENEDYNALCDEWVDLFSAVTSTTWVKKISNTGPQIRFRKQYQCWTQPGAVRKELLFDPRKCKATVDVKVLTDNPQTRRKNKYIKQGLNVVVKLNFTHLHATLTTKPFAFFVHDCEPQPEVPRSIPTTNHTKIIGDIVEKMKRPKTNSQDEVVQDQNHLVLSESNQIKTESDYLMANQTQNDHLNMIQLNQILPLQPYTQVVVTAPQFEEVLMCQPTLMFDPTQMTTLAPHFVQVHSYNLQAHNNETGNF